MQTTQEDSLGEQSGSNLRGGLLAFPALLEAGLRKFGKSIWESAERADLRGSLRWLAQNWARVGAWWLIVGLVLTGLLAFASLVMWKNPQAVISKLWVWGSEITGYGTLGAMGLSWLVALVTLPITLPLGLLVFLVGLAAAMAAIIFGPVMTVMGLGFALLFSLAFVKRLGVWFGEFIVKAIHKSDYEKSWMRQARYALGLHGGSAMGIEGNPVMLAGEELARFEKANRQTTKGASLFLGYVNGREFHYKTEKHAMIVASTRSGKGRDLLVPNLMMYPHSVFVLDPKGENCRKTAECREGRGGRIAAFDVENLTGRPSARFNPIAAMQKGDMVTRADYLAEALVVGKDDHWNNSARSLIRMLALHICTASEELLGGRARDLITLRALLTGLLDVTVKDYMPQNDAIDGLVARLAESFASIPDNERGSIVSTATQATRWLDNPALAALFRAGPDCIDFEALRDETKSLSIFVCLPAMVFATYPQIARLLTTFALDTMMRKETGRRRPVMFILDELAQLERLPIVERAFTLGAGYGVQVWAVFQSVEQVRKLYALDSLYGSSGFRGFFKLEDPESCEFASKCASGLYSPTAVRHMPEFGMLTLLDGANPLYVERLGARLAQQASERKAA